MDIKVILLSLGASFLLAVLLGPLFIPLLRRFKFGQQDPYRWPSKPFEKNGTPTMGGIIILLAIAHAFLKFSDKTSEFLGSIDPIARLWTGWISRRLY